MVIRENKTLEKSVSYIGMYLAQDTILAIKLSCEFTDFENFRSTLCDNLHFNSKKVRAIRTSNIVKWFFPSHSLEGLLTRVWRHYQEDKILEDIIRYQFLSNQPIAAKFIVNYLLSATPGTIVVKDDFESFLLNEYSIVKPYLLNNLRLDCRNLGFLTRRMNGSVVCKIQTPKAALIILTHYLFAKKPETIALRDILRNPYWQYLGISDPLIVRQVLRQADSEGIIAKYVKADQLEQITTKYSFEELLLNKIKIH